MIFSLKCFSLIETFVILTFRVKFPESVKWMSLEFDSACSTIQPEDSLQLYVPSTDHISNKKYGNHYLEDADSAPLPYWPVLHKFSGRLVKIE